jgi:DNA-directed RNA polymerase specialized sigma24 family protein
MNTQHPYLVQLIIQYNPLFTRYARRIIGGSQRIAEYIVEEAMEECYEAGEFRPTPQLRTILKNRVKAKAKLFFHPTILN